MSTSGSESNWWIRRDFNTQQSMRGALFDRYHTRAHQNNTCGRPECLIWYLKLLQVIGARVNMKSLREELVAHSLVLDRERSFHRLGEEESLVQVHTLQIDPLSVKLTWIRVFKGEGSLWLKVHYD